jgi:DNA-binding NtrC family response regulator
MGMSRLNDILVIDDDKSTRQWICTVLESEGYTCHAARNIVEAEVILRRQIVQLALVDIYLGDSNGVGFLPRIKSLQPDCECVMMTAHASVETMARAVKDGAAEYLGKPLRIDDLLELVRRLETHRESRSRAADSPEDDEPEGFEGTAIVGRSPQMLDVYRTIVRVAPTDATVLILGPSGAGKERVARAIHDHSRRANKLMTAVNCGALAEGVLESELFGHEKGAFTGADTVRRGLFESSNGGTIFLDEISETSPGFQVKLLRVLQERQVRRLGSNTFVPVDVRVIAASNADIGERIHARQFREDLYYRLSVVTIRLPSLDERREDIPLLARHFLQRFNERNERQVILGREAVKALTSRAWPGNVRELENLIERTAILSATGEITSEHIERASAAGAFSWAKGADTGETLKESERNQIVRALSESDGNRTQAAKKLGIERKTLYKKAHRLGIDLNAPEK